MVKRWTKKKIAIVSIISALVIIFSAAALAYNHVKNKIYVKSDRGNNTKVAETKYEEVKGITNVLLIGSDARDLNENSRSDSIIIATLDSNNKKVKLTSLFRDTLVDIPGYGEGKINSAFMLGGPELLKETISSTYGISIDKYVVINFWGFEAIIDQIGGLEIDVKDYQLEELNKYIGESTGGNDCPVEKPGLQLLNGKQTLSYARIRYNVGDEYERTDRQREVLFKVAEKLKETNPSKYLGIMNCMLDYIKTNIDPLEALNMAYTIYKFPELVTEQMQMPIVALSEARNYKDLGSCFLMDQEQNAKFLYSFIYGDKIPTEEDYDYDSLYMVLQKYAAAEAEYNKVNNINQDNNNDASKEEEKDPNKEEEKKEENVDKNPEKQEENKENENKDENKNENVSNETEDKDKNTQTNQPSEQDKVEVPEKEEDKDKEPIKEPSQEPSKEEDNEVVEPDKNESSTETTVPKPNTNTNSEQNTNSGQNKN